jgi:hypothetical protein
MWIPQAITWKWYKNTNFIFRQFLYGYLKIMWDFYPDPWVLKHRLLKFKSTEKSETYKKHYIFFYKYADILDL